MDTLGNNAIHPVKCLIWQNWRTSGKFINCLLVIVLKIIFLISFGPTSRASVTEIEILKRELVNNGKSFGDVGAYELIKGRLHYQVDPFEQSNRRIVDITLAPRNTSEKVSFTGDFLIIKPVDLSRGNGRLIYGVNNRGNIILLNMFNDARWTNLPTIPNDYGNGFLLKQGYTLLWTAWNWDVLERYNTLQIHIPVATNGGKIITGNVASEITTATPAAILPVSWGSSRGFLPNKLNDPNHRLTVRYAPQAERKTIPRQKWQFVENIHDISSTPVRIKLKTGFKPGLIYEVVYEAKNPRVTGLGLAAVRDAISFFRNKKTDQQGALNPLFHEERNGKSTNFSKVIIYGFSQSGRFIQHFLLEGFNVDEWGKKIFDGAFIHGPGAGKGSFNHRFAQTTRHPSHYEDHYYPADFYPFLTVKSGDPVTGKNSSLLDVSEQSNSVPKIFYVSSSTEYWTRAASLLHTDVDGKKDIAPDDRVRIYSIAGSQHAVSVQTGKGFLDNCQNPLDYRPLLRALLVALDNWVTFGKVPPHNNYPKIAEDLLGSVGTYNEKFPKIPNFRLPSDRLSPPRLYHGSRFQRQGIMDIVPAKAGPKFVTLVPISDEDGNDRGGIRLPEIAVPLGTYFGWNLIRHQTNLNRLARWQGSFVPFSATQEQRHKQLDSRRSMEERYASEKQFLKNTADVAYALHLQELILFDDVTKIVSRAKRAYRAVMQNRGNGCSYLGKWLPK